MNTQRPQPEITSSEPQSNEEVVVPKHPLQMSQSDLDALPENKRKEALAIISDWAWGRTSERQYLDGDYSRVGSYRATRWGR